MKNGEVNHEPNLHMIKKAKDIYWLKRSDEKMAFLNSVVFFGFLCITFSLILLQVK